VEGGDGDYETSESSVSGGFSGPAGDLDLGLSWIDSQGFPTRSDDSGDRGFENLSLTMGGHSAVGAIDLTARLWQAQGNTEYSDFFLTPVDQDFDNSAASLGAAVATGGQGRLTITAAYMKDEIRQNQSPDFLE